MDLGLTEVFTKRLMEATKGLGRRYIKGATKYCLLFDNWFFSKRFKEDVLFVGADMVGMVETNTKRFFLVGYGYVRLLLWEILILIAVTYFVMGFSKWVRGAQVIW